MLPLNRKVALVALSALLGNIPASRADRNSLRFQSAESDSVFFLDDADSSSTPTPSPSSEPFSFGRAQSSNKAQSPPEQDLTLIWMAITVWVLCFCAYAVAGEEQHSAAERARAMRHMERFNLSDTSTSTSRREITNNPHDQHQIPEVPYSSCIDAGVENQIDDVELDSCSICLDQFQLTTPVKKLRCGALSSNDCTT